MCRAALVREGSVGTGLTVIGDECHIVSPVPSGPRGTVPLDDLDGYNNLILLCPNDHRLIDTLVDEYPLDRLLAIKSEHEAWVTTTLAASAGLSPSTILRATPVALQRLGTAKELLNVAASAEESSLDHEEINTEEEVDLVAGFLQVVHDTAEMWDEYEPAFRIRTTFELDREMKRLEDLGWLVFGARASGKLRGGKSGGDTTWDTAYLRLVRADSPDIVRLDLAEADGGNRQSPKTPSGEPAGADPEPSASAGGHATGDGREGSDRPQVGESDLQRPEPHDVSVAASGGRSLPINIHWCGAASPLILAETRPFLPAPISKHTSPTAARHRPPVDLTT